MTKTIRVGVEVRAELLRKRERQGGSYSDAIQRVLARAAHDEESCGCSMCAGARAVAALEGRDDG